MRVLTRSVCAVCILLTTPGLADVPAEQATAPELMLQTRTAGAAGEAIDVPYFEKVDITVDGHIDEAVWSQVPGYDAMLVVEPDTLVQPEYQTISRFLYTSKGLYVAAFMEQPPETLISRLSSRDQYINRDSYGLTLDTSGEGLYGYWFVVNLGGSLMDGKVAPERILSEQWDGPWRGESARLPNGWSAEFFLPWSMMAMPAKSAARTMGFWVDRKVAHTDERYGWPALPLNAARFMSALQPVHLQKLETKPQFAIFPYASVTQDEIANEQDYRVGADLLWRPTTNLQVTATLNPDFGAVESDDVVVNLTAFETFFPEKRLFFLEGNEVFLTTLRSDVNRYKFSRGSGARATPQTFTAEPTTLLNTRRIGGPPKQVTVPAGVEVAGVELGKPTDLLGAVKVVGSNGGFRYGVLAAVEDDVELPATIIATGAPITVTEAGRNFGVIRALFESSGKGRRSIGYIGTIVTLPGTDAMTHGIDTHYFSTNGKLKWDTQFMYSDVDRTGGYGAFTDLSYTQRRGLIHTAGLDYIDSKLDISDLGFIRENDVITGRYGIVRSQSQGLDYFRQVRNSLFILAQTNTDGFANNIGIYTNQSFMFQNRSQTRFTVNYFPARWDDVNSRGNGMFRTDARWFAQIAYGTDTAKKFSWSGTSGAEQEELNGSWSWSFDFGFTYTPNDRFTVDLDLRFKKRDGWLVHRTGADFTTYAADDFQPRLAVDYFITARQQLRLTMQWAGIRAEAQEYWRVPISEGELIPRAAPVANEDFTLSRLTVQFRYRWEIGPLSDLFVVYTRGSSLSSTELDDGFATLFTDALDEPVVDFLVVKLRYRFGS
ncbi:MAG: DUF5916 domain-containing protein [Gammaproteobacteria bacterium]|nr:DUF5916 domain-containing protein [Gammaproteobacteria bacterium]